MTTRRGRAVAAALWAALGLGAAGLAAGERYDIVYSTDVATPHVPWATRLPGGPLRGFFIPSVAHGRDMVELLQRLSLDATTVTIDRNWDVNCWGIGDYYGHEYRGDRDDFATVYGYVEEELTGPKRFDVLLVPGLNGWSRLTRASRDAILRRVREGAGLVLLHPFVGDVAGHPFKGDEAQGDPRLWELSPLVGVADDYVSERGYPELNPTALARGRWERAEPHFVTEGLPLELLPAGHDAARFYRYEARGNVLVRAAGHPVLATRTYGRGRVVAFAYVEEGFRPEPIDPVETRVYWDYWEYEYALLVRSLLWAAGRESGLELRAPRALAGADGPGATLELDLQSRAPREVEVELLARDAFGSPAASARERRTLPAGRTVLRLETAALRGGRPWPGGRRIVDAIVREAAGGATLAFGTTSFEVPVPATVVALRPNAEVYHRGDTLTVTTAAAGALEGLQLRLELRDDLGRLVHVETRPARGQAQFFHRLDGFLGQRALLTASLLGAGGQVVHQLRAKPLVVAARERRAPEFRPLLSFESARHELLPLRRRLLAALGLSPGFTWGGAVNDSLDLPRGWFGVYWYDRGPTTPEGLEEAVRAYERSGDFGALQYLTKKELYRRTGDKRFLARSPSFSDPEALRVLADLSRTAARSKAVYNMDYYFVGDEGSLGSYADPVDFDHGPHALAGFRDWLRGEYGSLEALNRSWRSTYARWDDVVPSTTEEARRSGVFPPWADHRTYMEVAFANAYKVVRDAVVEADPQGHIAISGTQVTTPYNGCDWHRLDQVVDDFLSYDGGNQWDLHRSFAKPGARIGFWTGYGRSGAAVQHEIWTAALQGVLHPNVFWSYSTLDPDLGASRSAADMGAVFRALRDEGLGRLLMEAERLDDGVALHYSMASVHAAGILGLHPPPRNEDGRPELPAERDGWVRSLNDVGLAFRFVASPDVERAALERGGTKAFVLPLSLALSAEELAALERFARAGGLVVAGGAAGLFDEHVGWRTDGAALRLFGIGAPEPRERKLGPPLGVAAGAGARVTAAGAAWGLDAAALDGLVALEDGVAPADAETLVELGGRPVVFARRLGRGHAVYLNLRFGGYARARAAGYGGGGQRALVAALLARAGVRPAVEVRGAEGPLRRARYRFGGTEVLALLPEPRELERTHGRDGVALASPAAAGPREAQRLELVLSRAAEVTNARTGEALGRAQRLPVSALPGDALVLALDAPRVALTLRGPEQATRGAHPRFAIDAPGAAPRLVRVQVRGPDGAPRPEYAATLRLDGSAGEYVWPSAFDDPPGEYHVSVADVLGGGRAEGVVTLR